MNISKKYTIGIILGIVVGILTVIGQKYLSIEFNFLANSGAIWLIPAFLTSYYGKLNKGHSATVCIICLLCCVYGYYGFEAVINRHSFTIGLYTIIWTVCAFGGGLIFGLGAYFANKSSGFSKYCGLNLLPSVFLTEGINKIIHISGYMHMIPAVIMVTVIGVLIYFIINKKHAFEKWNLLSLLLITALGLLGYEILFRITI